MTEKFDYEQALADIKAGKPLTGKDSILSPLIADPLYTIKAGKNIGARRISMSEQSYTNEFLVSAKPELVYKAITKEINGWWTELSNQAQWDGDKLTVQFEDKTSWVMVVSEAVENQSLAWKVIEANHDLKNISTKDEWKGTTIRWRIEENKTGSKVSLFHEGLVPTLECYEICEGGWEFFLGSLKSYLNTGKGNPHKDALAK